MKKLAAFVALFCMTASLVSAATVTVRQDGTGNFTTIEAAIAGSVNGDDSIEIQQWTVPFTPPASLQPGWRSVICTTAEPAPVQFTQYNGWDQDHGTVKNIKMIGTGNGDWEQGLTVWGTVTVEDCIITGFANQGINFQAGVGESLIVKNTYVYPSGTSKMGDAVVKTYGGTLTIDHCTLVGDHDATNAGIRIDDSVAADYTGSNITVTNTIIDNVPSAIRAYNANALAVVEHHNDFNSWWDKPLRCKQDSVVYDMAATDIAVAPHFRNAAGGDYRLTPWEDKAPCIGQGENGTNIGADLLTVPVELSSFSAE